MTLSLKHQLQRWTVHQLHRIGFTNVTLATPLPTRGDGSTFDIDIDDDHDDMRPEHGPVAGQRYVRTQAKLYRVLPTYSNSAGRTGRGRGLTASRGWILVVGGMAGLLVLVLWGVGWV
ncbi:hypothetical protein AJ79_00301 [Helicocarpus griseus UAMH5409]|uniref:Uncharacterized protein n=1 Tax=Helicocarpus griseus UAMH5409 TaxID=1447875 RepID=A0A2B7Y355_9EURO|nr:hypothetical protein AJ79_00301 [Helicocarpus griseus UAMH5409]